MKLKMRPISALSFYSVKFLMAVSGLTGQEGYDVVTYRYDIYGEETQSAATYNPYRYNAEYTDMATGLQYLRSRYYSPAITRFLSKDPVLGVTTLPYTFNPYLYCLNNAVNYFDPNGMFFKEVFGAVAGAAKGVWNAGKAMFDSDVTVAEGWNSGWQSGKAAGNWRGGLWDNSVSNAWDKAEHRIQTIMNYDNQVRQSRALDPNGEAPYYGTEASWFDGISYKIRDNAMGVYSNKQEIEELDIEYENLEWQLQKASTERAFHYFQSGKIKEIIDGQESCLVIYNDGNSTYGYNIIPKTERGYKIPSYFEMKKVSHKFDKQAALDIYNAQGTQDYYVVGTVHQKDFDSDISVCNPAKEKIDIDIIRIENTDFICFWLPNFSNGYYLRINGEEIAL